MVAVGPADKDVWGTKSALFGVNSKLILCYIIKQLMTFDFGEYKD